MRYAGKRMQAWAITGVILIAGAVVAVSVAAATPPVVSQPAAVGQSVSFSGTGFNANEAVSLWATAPDKSVTPLPGNQADGHGALSANVSFSTDGYWQVTAHGIDSGKEVIGGYNVGVAANATSGTASGTVSASTAGATPTGATTVAANQATTFTHSGFQSSEMVSLWTTGPDGKVTALDGASADQSGNVIVTVSFPTSGYWQVTAHGLNSGRESIGGFMVGDLTTAATSAAGVIGTPAAAVGTPVPTVNPYPGLSSPLSTAAPTALAGLVQPGGAQSTYVVGPVPSSTGRQYAGA